MSPPVVRAAGGVLWRGDAAAPEVALVHRPAYDDWSIPKGKAKPGEHLLVTAVRETVEETGHRPQVGPYLRTVRYRVRAGGRSATKVVTYWSMRALGGVFEPSDEVDDIGWHPVEAARERVSSESDRVVLDAFAHADRDTAGILLVRHAATQAPPRTKGRQGARRLSRPGREQASALVPVLSGLGVQSLLSADLPACAETLQPFAAASGLPVRVDTRLGRAAFREQAAGVVDELRRHARDGVPVAVCGQRRVIQELVHALGHGAPARLPHDLEIGKGGWWLLHQGAGAVIAFERHDFAA